MNKSFAWARVALAAMAATSTIAATAADGTPTPAERFAGVDLSYVNEMEACGAQFRLDFPKRDDDNWLKHIDLTLNGTITTSSGITKIGAGALRLAGTAAVGGAFDVQAGRLALGGGLDNRISSSLTFGSSQGLRYSGRVKY